MRIAHTNVAAPARYLLGVLQIKDTVSTIPPVPA